MRIRSSDAPADSRHSNRRGSVCRPLCETTPMSTSSGNAGTTQDIIRRMPLTREHIVWAYRILLDRDPESDAAIQPKLTGCQTTQQLRADIVTSQEYRDKNPDFAHTNDRTIVIREFDGGIRLFVDLSDHLIGLPIVRGQYECAELDFIRRV